MKINKGMTIGELVQNYPSVAEVLQNEGVHCVGCFAANMETIEMGLKGHGMSDEQVNKILANLNKAANSDGEEK